MRVRVFICEWRPLNGANYPRLIHNQDLMDADSVEDLPQWVQERYAVLRLFDNDEDSPLGGWAEYSMRYGEGLMIFIVPQPEDPVQLKERTND